jgi:hypothetical protein
MRYYSYAEFSGAGDADIIKKSEEQILNEYWNTWYTNMCHKYSKDYVDNNYTKQDCIEDWIIVHWAQEAL